MPRKLTALEQSRRKEYVEICQKIPMSQGALASNLGVRRECICKRLAGGQPVTVEALLSLRLIAGLPMPEDDLSDL